MKYDDLIYGKDHTERIVSIEVQEDVVQLFIENPDGSIDIRNEPNTFWILSNRPRDKNFLELDGLLEYRFAKEYENRQAYLRDRKIWKDDGIYSVYNPKEACMLKDGYTYFKGMKHDEVSVLSFDIETTTLKHLPGAEIIIITNTFRKLGKTIRKIFTYDNYANNGEMLKDWCNWVRDIDPSIICGHNIFTFDLPYMQYIAGIHKVKLVLGRNDDAIHFDSYESEFRKDMSQRYHYYKASVYGRELIDTFFLSIKYDTGRKYPNYRLKEIIKFEELEVKDRVFYDASKIRFNYKDPVEWEKIKAYAEHDADDALALYDLMSPPFFYMTQAVPRTFQHIIESATGALINGIMVRSYLQEGWSIPKDCPKKEYEGAISFGNPGVYSNVYKIDVASLYPSIMIHHKVHDPKKDPKQNFLKLVQIFTNQRLEHKALAKKDKYYDDLQNAEKIFINSCYGFLGTKGCNFNFPEGAAFVTRTGREILQKSIAWAEGLGFKIVNADTDSISFCRTDGGEIDEQEQKRLLQEVNALFPEKIRFEDDGYYRRIIVAKAKNYILWDGKKAKTKGSALKATTKEAALRQFIQDIIHSMLELKDNQLQIYNTYALEIMKIEDMSRWCSKKTITDKVLNPKRTNEEKVLTAIKGKDYTEGDKAFFFFKCDKTLCLVEDFTGDYDKKVLLKKLFKTSIVFKAILPHVEFLDYSLKRNQGKIDALVETSNIDML